MTTSASFRTTYSDTHGGALRVLPKTAYDQRGFVVRQAIFDRGEMVELGQVMTEYLRSNLNTDAVEQYGDAEGPYGRLDVAYGLTDEIFGEPMLSAVKLRAREEAAKLLDATEVSVVSDELFVKPPLYGAPLTWHQDWPTWPELTEDFVTCWIPFTDITSIEAGPLVLVPGTNRKEKFLPAEFHTAPVPDVRLLALEESGMAILPLHEISEATILFMSVGDCSFHHSRTWHCSLGNVYGEPRAALALRFVRTPG